MENMEQEAVRERTIIRGHIIVLDAYALGQLFALALLVVGVYYLLTGLLEVRRESRP